jgi:capsid protein
MPTDDQSNRRLGFHNAVMRWKCSGFTDEERQDLQDWIDDKAMKKEIERKQPWKVMQETGADEISTENGYIQRYAPGSPSTKTSLTPFQLHRRSPGYNRKSTGAD